jgi:hypothetical protein
MAYIHTKFHISSFSDLLDILLKPKSVSRIHGAAILLFYILQNFAIINVVMNVVYF